MLTLIYQYPTSGNWQEISSSISTRIQPITILFFQRCTSYCVCLCSSVNILSCACVYTCAYLRKVSQVLECNLWRHSDLLIVLLHAYFKNCSGTAAAACWHKSLAPSWNKITLQELQLNQSNFFGISIEALADGSSHAKAKLTWAGRKVMEEIQITDTSTIKDTLLGGLWEWISG